MSLLEGDQVLDPDIVLAESEAALWRIVPVLRQLRPAFTEAALVAQIQAQQREGYRLAYLCHAGEVACVAGFRIGLNLAWGRHLYVDDLVTAEACRSAGAGTRMVAWLKDWARQQGCTQLHLDSGLQRIRAHAFYRREGFTHTSHHFSVGNLQGVPPTPSD